jgi:hypothetical protein
MILISTEIFYSLLLGKDSIRENIGQSLEELIWKGKKLNLSMHSIMTLSNDTNFKSEWIDETSVAFHQIFPLDFAGFRNAKKLSDLKSISIELALDISVASINQCSSILVMKKYPKDISNLPLIPIFGKSN